MGKTQASLQVSRTYKINGVTGPRFKASKVRVLANKRGSYIQFTLTMMFGTDEAACTWRNCLCGISKSGPWVMPSQSKYKTAVWNKAFSDRIIDGFRKAGTLKQIEDTGWDTETEEVEVDL